MLKKKEGITLIALVVTIIVLLILAGVTLALVSGENGILKRATHAVEVDEKATAEEEANLLIADIVAQYYEEKYVNHKEDLETVDDYIKNQLTKEKETEGGYGVKYNEETGKIEVSKEEHTISSGAIANGKIEWPKENTGDNSGGNETNPPPEIPEGLVVGSTVSYNPSGTYNWQAEYCSSTKTIGKGDVNLSSAEGESFHVNSWRVFSIDKATGKVQIVPVAPTAGTVYLGQAQGYNNAVKLLNDACSNLYSDENKGITARSINMEDIESVMDQAKIDIAKTSQGYGTQNTNAFSKGASNYPVIYGREESAIIDGILKESGLGLNEQNKLIGRTEIENGKTATGGKLQADTSIQPFNTSYAMNNNDFSEALGSTHTEVLVPSGIKTVDYWVASRFVTLTTSVAHFGVCMVESGSLSGEGTFESMGYTNQHSKALFPIVSLRAEIIDGDATNGFRVK